jgi:sulfate adenylyltransferase/3'-phosphoadenosine 5'-phosphosulfate synthase
MSHPAGFVVWFTGLSGSGKSTLATLVAAELRARGVHVEVLDGDEVRTHLSKGLGFSREDRDDNVRRIGFVAKLLARAGACAMTAAISPYRAVRDEQRRAIGRFVEVYCKCPIDVLAARDPKGLYDKAMRGEIQSFTGISDPYEEPEDAEVVVDTANEEPGASARRVLEAIEALGYLEPRSASGEPPPPHGHELELAPRVDAGEPIAGAVKVDAAAGALLALAAAGALSPVAGPLGEKDATRVRKEARLESGLAWPLPFVLSLAPRSPPPAAGALLATPVPGLAVRVAEVWRDAGGAVRIAGPVVATEARVSPVIEARTALSSRGLCRVAGYLARGPLSEADERLLERGLEAMGGLLVVSPLGDDGADETVRAFERRHERVVVVRAPLLPPMAGPRDFVLVRLVLRNFGAAAALFGDPEAARAASSAFSEAEIAVPIIG